MRKLASIQTVNALYPIPSADAIEVAGVLGWLVVVKKNEFKVGDKVVYCEIDSVLPEKPEFEFLSKSKYRIKTIRLRGQVSQGICFPIDILPDGNYNEDDDVTEILGVTLYEAPESGDGIGNVEKVGTFPTHLVQKTDETRVQTYGRYLKANQGRLMYITEKMDGTSATYVLNDGEEWVASRNNRVSADGESVYAEMAKKYDLFNKMREVGCSLVIQGEIIGPGIQKNKYKLQEPKLMIFNIIEVETQRHFSLDEIKEFCAKHELEHVPVIDDGNFELTNDIPALVEMSKGTSALHDTPREGIVIRSVEGPRFSCKSINPEFLLRHGE